jgi:hypothetical protein
MALMVEGTINNRGYVGIKSAAFGSNFDMSVEGNAAFQIEFDTGLTTAGWLNLRRGP